MPEYSINVTLQSSLCSLKHSKIQTVMPFCKQYTTMLLVHFISHVRPKIQDTICVKPPGVGEELDPSIPLLVKVKHTDQDVRIISRSIKFSHLHVKPNKVISIDKDCLRVPLLQSDRYLGTTSRICTYLVYLILRDEHGHGAGTKRALDFEVELGSVGPCRVEVDTGIL